ncbi:MAG TPA: Nif3-like dinuclear metal center hexameric protein [Gemmatimonadaceae bacterium]|nr:Nif3-like dinuclear metal center hexameric protein [Gemmatimonadaceae bacterium]
MTDAAEIATYLDQLLDTPTIPDYPGALNGLQLASSGDVRRIGACVDFSSRTVAIAAEQAVNLLLVHHGMFWGGARPFTGVRYSQIRILLERNIAVYASHLPLDRHAIFGNNVLLSQKLGLEPSGEFASYRGSGVGVSGECDIATVEIVERARLFARIHGGDAIATGFPRDRHSRRWAICTGAGASAETLTEAVHKKIDTLIVGEGPHWTAVEATDLGIVIIYAGHYATETLGVAALAEHAAQKFGIEWTMIHAPTGL